MDALGARWMGALLSAAEQGLVDLAASSASEVSFVRHEDAEVLETYVDELERRAQLRGFVTARVSLGNQTSHATFDSMDVVVRTLLADLSVPSLRASRRSTRRGGLLALLDAFLHAEGRAAIATFDQNLGRVGASGDLVALARAYLESAKKPRREAARIEAWMSGVELARFDVESVAVSALAARTAKRALGELTRLVQALGHAGSLFIFTDGEVLLHLPPARRDDAYTVLRELVDNTDTGRGLVATRLVVAGKTPLFVGPKSLASLAPLQSRVASTDDVLPTPHRLLKAWAVAAYRSGALREARRAADAWILIESTPEPHILLAEILEGMGHRGEARAVLAEVLDSHPESTQARRLAARYGTPSSAPETSTSSQRSQVARR